MSMVATEWANWQARDEHERFTERLELQKQVEHLLHQVDEQERRLVSLEARMEAIEFGADAP